MVLFLHNIHIGGRENGYRTEGMTAVAKDLARKLVGTIGASIKAFILSKIGYVEGAGYGNQSERTEYLLFMMCTLLPTVTSVFGLIPKFFYDLSGEKKERMYRELAERRRSIMNQMDELKSNKLLDTNE